MLKKHPVKIALLIVALVAAIAIAQRGKLGLKREWLQGPTGAQPLEE